MEKMRIDFYHIWPALLCLVPVYSHDGTNGTEIRCENGTCCFSPLRTKTLVRQLARVFHLDLKAATEYYSELTGRRYAVPIPVRSNLVLIPVRARRARIKDDGTQAYLVKSKIAKISPFKGKTRITFTDSSYLEVTQSWTSLRVLFTQAELVESISAKLRK